MIHIGINIKTDINTTTDEVVGNLKKLSEKFNSSGEFLSEYTWLPESNSFKLVVARRYQAPSLIVDFYAETNTLTAHSNSVTLGVEDGQYMGIPLREFASLLSKCTFHEGVGAWYSELMSLECPSILHDIPDLHDLYWRCCYENLKYEVSSVLTRALSQIPIVSGFEIWTKSFPRCKWTLNKFLPFIEEEHPGFTENLKWVFDIRQEQGKRRAREDLKDQIQILSLLCNDEVLCDVAPINHEFRKSRVAEIAFEADHLDFNFQYPADVDKSLMEDIEIAIDERKN